MPAESQNLARYSNRFERSGELGLIHSGTSEELGAQPRSAAGRLPMDERPEID